MWRRRQALQWNGHTPAEDCCLVQISSASAPYSTLATLLGNYVHFFMLSNRSGRTLAIVDWFFMCPCVKLLIGDEAANEIARSRTIVPLLVPRPHSPDPK
ncbi:hypothetical protein BS78_06G051200 [Paspalum vaginatum]|nr:hypothetical protein BS78_06G051200 [Paspalum vaginatum]